MIGEPTPQVIVKLITTLDELLEYAEELYKEGKDEDSSRYRSFIHVASSLRDLISIKNEVFEIQR